MVVLLVIGAVMVAVAVANRRRNTPQMDYLGSDASSSTWAYTDGGSSHSGGESDSKDCSPVEFGDTSGGFDPGADSGGCDTGGGGDSGGGGE